MPHLIVFVAAAAFVLSCSQEPPTAQPADPHIQEAKASGSDECPTQAFNIDLQFFDNVDYKYRLALQRAANRWESVIQGDLTNISFWSDPLDEWSSSLGARVYFKGTVDDLRIIVRATPLSGATVARSGVLYVRTYGGLPIVSGIALDQDALKTEAPEDVERILLHEIAHCLGFGTTNLWDSFVQEWPATRTYHDPHFDGLFASISFDIAGGRNYAGEKVPIDRIDGGHWRSTLGDELLAKGWTYPYRQPLSEITVGALSDMGYNVSFYGAEHYATPTAASKRQTGQDARGSDWCKVVRGPVRER